MTLDEIKLLSKEQKEEVLKRGYWALHGLLATGEAHNLAMQASLAAMQGDMKEALRLMVASKEKSAAYDRDLVRFCATMAEDMPSEKRDFERAKSGAWDWKTPAFVARALIRKVLGVEVKLV